MQCSFLHAHTWVLEKQDIRPGRGQLLSIGEFAESKKETLIDRKPAGRQRLGQPLL